MLDEPCSALDPISVGKFEELCHELRGDDTLAIVTRNLQQAAGVSGHTPCMRRADLIELGNTNQLFMKPMRKETEDHITGPFS